MRTRIAGAVRGPLERGSARVIARILRASGLFRSYWAGWRDVFDLFEASGFHALPVHHYSPIPDARDLPPALWREPADLVGIDLRAESALRLLAELASAYAPEYRAFPQAPTANPLRYAVSSLAFGAVDASILHAMVRWLKPQRVVEIGAGDSTRVIAAALGANRAEGHPAQHTAIDPSPAPILRDARLGLDHLMAVPVQEIGLDFFGALEAGDLLFVDGSHAARIGSDVLRTHLEILPRLAAGVVVHVHDIFLPWEYPEHWIRQSRFFWNEQYLLRALLCNNDAFEVLLPLHHLYRSHRAAVERAVEVPEGDPIGPSSFWMRRSSAP
jgi:predicted O-methyltransferase YrrM